MSSSDESDICCSTGRSMVQRGSYDYEAIRNVSDKVMEGQSSVRMEEESVERSGWTMNY